MAYGDLLNYPTEVRQLHYSIEAFHQATRFTTNGRVYSHRSDALDDLRAMREADLLDADWYLNEHESVFYAWCVLCGKIGPDWPYCAYLDWDSAHDATIQVPGWAATSDQLIFCPDEPRRVVERWL